ncbi:hypothetical protein H4R34_003955, partial [Dimargaris verticillata]
MAIRCQPSLAGVAKWLPVGWMALIVYVEVVQYWWVVGQCGWPRPPSLDTHAASNSVRGDSAVFRLAIVADPQITDEYSYGLHGPLLFLNNFITDLYAKKNYRLLTGVKRPNAAVILGDMFDGGRHWTDDAWLAEYGRFQRIFRNHGQPRASQVPKQSASADYYNADSFFYHVVGNHDVGVGDTIIPSAITRYQQYFGPLSYHVTLGNHTLVSLNDLALDSNNPAGDDARAFLDIFGQSQAPSPMPRLLFTHIPLYRPANTDCGPDRHRGHTINQQFGFQYQDLVRSASTQRILDAIRPAVVFTGDDHDQCLVHHDRPASPANAITAWVPPASIPEYTIGSFSLAGGNTVPSFALLSLYNPLNDTAPPPPETPTWALQLCFLPNHVAMYIMYGIMALLTLVFLAFEAWVNHDKPGLFSFVSPLGKIGYSRIHAKDYEDDLYAQRDQREPDQATGEAISLQVMRSPSTRSSQRSGYSSRQDAADGMLAPRSSSFSPSLSIDDPAFFDAASHTYPLAAP